MTWTFLWLMVALKIPIFGAIWIVWWAVKQEPTPADETSGDDGGSRRPHPRPTLPRLPRRGPHGTGAPLPPPRVRSVVARARSLHG